MKVGFLFGAGAEVSYNMPTGGSFALDIFRQDPTQSKKEFKDMRSQIGLDTEYAATWLPENFCNRNIGTFGKSVFENIIKDTIEHNRSKVIEHLNNFDAIAESVSSKMNGKYDVDIDKILEEVIGRDLDCLNMSQMFAFANEFSEGNSLFSNKYFSALLSIYKRRSKESSFLKKNLGEVILSIIQLQVGALSESLTRRINDSPFSKKDDDIDLFDDLGDLINLNYSLSGVSGLNYLLDQETIQEPFNCENHEYSRDYYIALFARSTLESIFSDVIDYKSLIDTNWHYLYCPKNEWSKFCKICIFLFTVLNYIENQCKKADKDKSGYYDDLNEYIEDKKIEISAIATTNYTSLIAKKISSPEKIYFLNGSTEKWYDPYLNRIGLKDQLNKDEKHFVVPLLFTQSGTKPMTSIHMSKEYVQVYDAFYQSDIICVVGFGFNLDDEHINGIFRDLVDNDKHLIIVTIKGDKSTTELEKMYAKRLKVNKRKNIHAILVDRNRMDDEKLWLDTVLSYTSES